jgi:hypothetical protein
MDMFVEWKDYPLIIASIIAMESSRAPGKEQATTGLK